MVRYCKFLTGHLWGKIYRRTLKEVLIGYKPMGEGLVMLPPKNIVAGRGKPGHVEKGENGMGFSGVTCLM